MTPCRLFAASLFVLLCAGCSADGPVTASAAVRAAESKIAAGAALSVDPTIPALTIVAHRMNDNEKKAFDRESQTTVATIQP